MSKKHISRRGKSSSTQKIWRSHIAAWQKSGLSRAEYCRQNNLSSHALGYWHKKYKDPDQVEMTLVPVPLIGKTKVKEPQTWSSELKVEFGDRFILASYPDKGITPMKLQKLAYYSKAWTLVAEMPFVSAQFEKWNYGPINYSIYSEYKSFKNNIINKDHSSSVSLSLETEQASLLKFILANYVNYSAFSLSAMTHNEAPWLNASNNEIISDEVIIDYYSKQPFAKNFINKASLDGPFHVLQSDAWHAFTLDMEPEEAIAFESYPSYNDFLKQNEKVSSDYDELIKTLIN